MVNILRKYLAVLDVNVFACGWVEEGTWLDIGNKLILLFTGVVVFKASCASLILSIVLTACLLLLLVLFACLAVAEDLTFRFTSACLVSADAVVFAEADAAAAAVNDLVLRCSTAADCLGSLEFVLFAVLVAGLSNYIKIIN